MPRNANKNRSMVGGAPAPSRPLVVNPPGQGQSKSARRRRRKRNQNLGPFREPSQYSSGLAAAAVAYARTAVGGEPKILSQSADSIRIQHVEPVAKIMGTVEFSTYSYFLNPGNQLLFPWLSSQARGWQKYTFHSCKLISEPRCPSSTEGCINLAFDLNVSDALPSSSIVAGTYRGSAESSPWREIISVADCSRIQPDLYINTGPVPVGQDLKTIYAGKAIVCTEDGAAVPWCKLYIEYDVTLSVQQLSGLGSYDVGAAVGVAPSPGNPIGLNPTRSGLWTNNLIIGSSGNCTFNVPVGLVFWLSYNCAGTGLSAFGITNIVGATPSYNVNSVQTTEAQGSMALLSTAPQVTFKLNMTGTTVTSSHMVVALLPNGSGF